MVYSQMKNMNRKLTPPAITDFRLPTRKLLMVPTSSPAFLKIVSR